MTKQDCDLAAAKLVAERPFDRSIGVSGGGWTALIGLAMWDAVQAEREACARLADKAEPLPNVDSVWLSGFRCAAESIARLIRTRRGQ